MNSNQINNALHVLPQGPFISKQTQVTHVTANKGCIQVDFCPEPGAPGGSGIQGPPGPPGPPSTPPLRPLSRPLSSISNSISFNLMTENKRLAKGAPRSERTNKEVTTLITLMTRDLAISRSLREFSSISDMMMNCVQCLTDWTIYPRMTPGYSSRTHPPRPGCPGLVSPPTPFPNYYCPFLYPYLTKCHPVIPYFTHLPICPINLPSQSRNDVMTRNETQKERCSF